MNTKYRLVQRKGRWAVQRPSINRDIHEQNGSQFADYNAIIAGKWTTIFSWPFRWCAALHLLILRERARKRK